MEGSTASLVMPAAPLEPCADAAGVSAEAAPRALGRTARKLAMAAISVAWFGHAGVLGSGTASAQESPYQNRLGFLCVDSQGCTMFVNAGAPLTIQHISCDLFLDGRVPRPFLILQAGPGQSPQVFLYWQPYKNNEAIISRGLGYLVPHGEFFINVPPGVSNGECSVSGILHSG